MKANNIQEFFGTLQQATVEAWKEHLKTNKYSAHIALNDFYEDIVELVDTLIEDYQGIYGIVDDLKNILTTEKIDAIEYLETLRELTVNGRKDFLKEEDPELLSDVDAILSLIDSTLYKLKELKENEEKGISLKNYLNESLGKPVNEAKEEAYSVAFNDFKDKKGIPITTVVYVPREYAKEFQKYLEKEAGNSVYKAEGYTNDWELED